MTDDALARLQAWAAAAEAALAEGRHRDALVLADRIRAERPGAAAGDLLQLRALIGLDPEQATARAIEALARHEGDPRFRETAHTACLVMAAEHRARGRLPEAEAVLGLAAELAVDAATVLEVTARLRADSGDRSGAEQALRAAVSRAPGRLDFLSALVSLEHYDPESTGPGRRAAAVDWARRLSQGVAVRRHRPEPGRGPGPLRVGYVSGDLGDHPVGHFATSLFAAHDPARVTAIGYANGYPRRSPDPVTAVAQRDLAVLRDISGLDDDAAAAVVAADRIDILVDLSGHTAGNRLGVFARRPAPVQCSWLGYWGTTGLPTMDWLICDAVTVPPEQAGWYVEKPLRLPGCYLTMACPTSAIPTSATPTSATPTAEIPIAADRPGPAEGPVFGSYHRLLKLDPLVIRLWSSILHDVPGSRLVLRTRALESPAARQRVQEAFAACGIQAARLVLAGFVPRPDMLASYAGIDVALDPLPFGGVTTTMEALWMGVPVVTMLGDRFAGRFSASVLQATGDDALIAEDTEDYRRIAVALAGDPARRAGLRAGLPERMRRTVGDAAAFARKLEDAYATIWRAWSGLPSPGSVVDGL